MAMRSVQRDACMRCGEAGVGRRHHVGPPGRKHARPPTHPVHMHERSRPCLPAPRRKGRLHGTGRFIARPTDLTGVIDVRDPSPALAWGGRGSERDDGGGGGGGGGRGGPRIQSHEIYLEGRRWQNGSEECASTHHHQQQQRQQQGALASGQQGASPSDRGPLETRSDLDPDPGPTRTVLRAYVLPEHPGLIVIPDALPPEVQRELVRKSLSVWPEPPANTNHTLR